MCFFTVRCNSRIVSCSWSTDGSMIVCGSGDSHVFVYHFDTGRSDSILVILSSC